MFSLLRLQQLHHRRVGGRSSQFYLYMREEEEIKCLLDRGKGCAAFTLGVP